MNANVSYLKDDLIAGASAEALSGGAAGVLAIIGLAHVYPTALLAISGIAIGAGLMLEGASIAAEHKKLILAIAQDKWEHINVDMGMSVELLGGLSAIVLGILSVLGLDPTILMPAAAIIVGTSVLLSSGTMARMNALRLAANDIEGPLLHAAREIVNASAMTQVLVGMGAIVLGILAIIGIASTTLTLIAFLALGSSLAISGSAIGGRIFGAFKAP